MGDAWGLFDLARRGDYLAEPEHLDALDVAVSLGEHLDEATRTRLGRVVIDARTARETSVDEPGARLLLEDGRVVLFGRAPCCGEPGELEPGAKWSSVVEALALLGSGPAPDPQTDWLLLDVRWDRPEIVLRNPPLAMADEAGPAATRAPSIPDSWLGPAPERPRRETGWRGGRSSRVR